MNKMRPNMPRNIHPNRFYLEKKNCEEIIWPFIIRLILITSREICYGLKKLMQSAHTPWRLALQMILIQLGSSGNFGQPIYCGPENPRPFDGLEFIDAMSLLRKAGHTFAVLFYFFAATLDESILVFWAF
jgi:hypothetical protein